MFLGLRPGIKEGVVNIYKCRKRDTEVHYASIFT